MRINSGTLALLVIFLVVLVVNFVLWIKPQLFIQIMQIGKSEKYPFYKTVWQFMESPNYIWFPRILFTVGLALTFYLILKFVFSVF